MVWFRVNDGFYSSRKVISIPRSRRYSAVGLWLLAATWSASNLTDGAVSGDELAELGARRADVQTLLEAGLWDDDNDGGIVFHDWEDYQPSRLEVLTARAEDAERKRRGREAIRARAAALRDVSGRTPGGTPDGFLPESGRPDPTRPDPTLNEADASSGGKLAELPLPSSWTPTRAHFEMASKLGVDVVAEADSFRLHAETHDRRAARWNAAFTTWLKKAKPAPRLRAVSSDDQWMYDRS